MAEQLAIHDFLSEEEQKFLLQLIPDEVILVTPADQCIVYINHPPFGMPWDQVLGRPYWELGSLRGQAIMRQTLQRVIDEQIILEQEAELYVAGHYRWSLIRMLPVMRQGKLHYVLMTHANITPLKNAINALEFSQKRLQDHLDQTPLAAMMWDTQGVTVEWNPAAEKMFGYSRMEAVGRHFTDLIVSKESAAMHRFQYQQIILTGKLDINPRAENMTRDGREILCEWFSTILRNSQGEIVGIAGLAQDITLKNQAEKDREAAKLAAEASAKAKAHFLANMSHEIRTPMNGILGMIELMKLDSLSKAQQDKLDIIHQSTQTLLTILNDVLDFSKIESNAMLIERIPIDINKLLEQIIGLMRPALEKKNLAFKVQLLPDAYRYVLGDPNRINQVMSNLISNAIKFTERGSVEIIARYESVDAQNTRIMIDIIDTGIGIHQEDLQHIFDDFAQADASITRRYGGTGLGLTICQRLAKLMGGEIRVQSVYQQGSCFTFEWHTQICPAPTSETEPNKPFQRKQLAGVVLLVDDNEVNLLVAKSMLETLGLSVISANNGKQALAALERGTAIDVILMDMHMPEMNGLDATRILRQNPQFTDLPVIAVTANVLEEEKQQCLAAGMNDWLGKPFSLSRLNEKLAPWLIKH